MRTTIILPDDVHAKLKEESKRINKPITRIIADAIIEHIEKHEAQRIERNTQITNDLLNTILRHIMTAEDQRNYESVYDHPTLIYRKSEDAVKENIRRKQLLKEREK